MRFGKQAKYFFESEIFQISWQTIQGEKLDKLGDLGKSMSTGRSLAVPLDMKGLQM